MRPEDGARGRFKWATQTTREANIAATAYLVGGLERLNLPHCITEEDRLRGRAWVQSLHLGNQQYHDPALLDRRPPEWPAGSAWPSPQIQASVNNYCQSVLGLYGIRDLPPAPPPPGLPQPGEVEQSIASIRSMDWKTDPWGTGSWSMRLAAWLLQWYKEGIVESIDPFITAINFFYEIQDPKTGLWGNDDAPLQLRLNGTFKLFTLLQGRLLLPLHFADKIIDSTLESWSEPDWDANGGCEEGNNLYLISYALMHTDHRRDEVERAVLRRLNHMRRFEYQDGGFIYEPSQCVTHCVGIDMAPRIRQSDVMGLSCVTMSVNMAIELLGLHGMSPYTGQWRGAVEDASVRNLIISKLRI